MLIGKFNRYFAKHGKVTLLFVLIVICFPLVLLFGQQVEGLRGGSLFGGNEVVTVFGKPVGEREFMRQCVAVELFYSVLRGGQWLDLRPGSDTMRQIAQPVFQRLQVLHEARRLGLDPVSDEEVAKFIMELPSFKDEKGGFNREAFGVFKANYLTRRDLTAREFDGLVREEIATNRVMRRQLEPQVLTTPRVRLQMLADFTQCEAELLAFPYSDFNLEVIVTDDEVRKVFDQEKGGKYKVPLKRRLLVATYRSQDFAPRLPVTDEEISRFYEEQKAARFTTTLIHVRDLVLRPDATNTPEVLTQKLKELRTQALAKNNFGELAREFSHDKVTGAKGGDLGFIRAMERGQIGREAANLKDGEISDVFSDAAGLHLV